MTETSVLNDETIEYLKKLKFKHNKKDNSYDKSYYFPMPNGRIFGRMLRIPIEYSYETPTVGEIVEPDINHILWAFNTGIMDSYNKALEDA